MLAKGAIEPLTGDADFFQTYQLFPNVLVTYDLYSTFGDLIAICAYLLFKTPTIRQVWQLIQHVYY